MYIKYNNEILNIEKIETINFNREIDSYYCFINKKVFYDNKEKGIIKLIIDYLWNALKRHSQFIDLDKMAEKAEREFKERKQ